MTLGLYILLPLFLAISFLCAGMEAGVLALSRWRIRQQAREGRRRAKVLMNYLDRPENFLWTILVANTLANFGALALIVYEIFMHLRGYPVACLLVFGGALLLFYAICDLFPKLLFRMYPNRLCLLAAIPFQIIHLLMAPLTALTQRFSDLFLKFTGGKAYTGKVFSSRKELRMAMQDSTESLSNEERAMIMRVLDLQQTTVGQLTLPFWGLPTVTSQMTGRQLLEATREVNRNHVPVWESSAKERVAGIIDLRAILYSTEAEQNQPIADKLIPALFIVDHVKAEEALRRLQRSGKQMAIVMDADLREVGILGIEEILRSIFGEVKI